MVETTRESHQASDMHDHWRWRPEWTPERPCLYWYLVFRGEDVATALGEDVLRAFADADWMDAIPPQWCHVTLTDVGFVDQLGDGQVERVIEAVTDALTGEERLRLRFQHVRAWNTAVVLSAEPVERLRAVRTAARRATMTALAQDRPVRPGTQYRPHLSLGYVNREVDAATVSGLLDRLPDVDVGLDVDALTLAAVTRRNHHYQWEVRAEVPLSPAGG